MIQGIQKKNLPNLPLQIKCRSLHTHTRRKQLRPGPPQTNQNNQVTTTIKNNRSDRHLHPHPLTLVHSVPVSSPLQLVTLTSIGPVTISVPIKDLISAPLCMDTTLRMFSNINRLSIINPFKRQRQRRRHIMATRRHTRVTTRHTTVKSCRKRIFIYEDFTTRLRTKISFKCVECMET